MKDEDKTKEQLLEELKKLRRQTLEELSQSSALFSQVMETSPAGIVVLDRKGAILTANLQATRVLGLARDQITGLTYNDPQWRITDYQGNPLPDDQLPFRQVMDTGQPVYEVQHAIEGPDGRKVFLSINAAPFFDDSGQVERVVATVEDVTQREKIERDLRQTRKEWEEIFQAVGHPTIILDAEHTIIAANRAAVRAIGNSEQEIIGKKCYEVFHGADQPTTGCPMERLLASGSVETVEMEMEALGGVFLVSCTPMVDDRGSLHRVIHIATDITERKRSEKALREESSFRSAVIENAAEGLCVCHETTEHPYVRFTLWNDQMTKITGYTMEEINRLGWYQTVYPDSELQSSAKERMARMRQGDNLRGEPWEIIRADGEKRIINISTSILISSDRVGHVLALMNDVTEPRRAEEELRQSEERLQLVLEGSQQGFWDWNLETGEVKRNELWAEMLGYTLQEIDSSVEQWLSLIHPADRAAAQKSLQDHLEGRTSVHEIECRMLTKNKQYKWILDRGRIVERDIEGRPLRMSGTHIDITERKQVEEALQEAHQKLQAIIQASPLSIFVLDPEGKVLMWNPASTSTFGWTEEEAVGRVLPIVPEEKLDEFRENLRRGLASEPLRGMELRRRKKDGTPIDISIFTSPLHDAQGKVIGIMALNADITERKQAADELEQSISLLQATLESTADGLLVIDSFGKIVAYNQKFAQMWRIPEAILSSRDDDRALAFVLEQLTDPEGFLSKVRELYGQPEAESYDLIEFKDGRVFERYSQAQRIGRTIVGRVWSFRDVTARRQAEEALRESEEKYRLLVRQIPAVVFKGYADWSVDFFDNKIETLTGYSKAEFDSRHLKWCDLILPEDLDYAIRIFINALKNDGSYVREHRIRRTEGEIRWVQCRGRIFYDAAGEIDYISGVIFDITESKGAEEALLKYKFIANTSKDCMTLIDRNYFYEAANTAYCQAHGKTREEVVGTSVANVWGEDRFEKVIKGYLDRCFTGQTVEFEGWIEFGKKGRGCYYVFYSPYFNEDGTVAYAAVVSHDITKRKMVEELLRQSEVKYRQLVDQIPAVVYKGYTDWSLDCFDRKIEAITGYAQEEFNSRRKTWRDLILPEDINQAKKLFRGALKGDGFYVTEHRIRKKTGEVRWIQAINRIICDAARKVDYISGVFFDITERKELEDQLIKAQRMEAVGILAGGLAHDFNNLLTAIMGYGEIMMMDLRKEDPFSAYIKEIMKAASRGAALTNQLLAFSRKQILQPQVINLNEVVVEMEKMLRRLIGEDIDLVTLIDQKLGRVKADPAQIEQIIMNLVVNARDALPNGGSLTLETANVYLDQDYARNHVGVTPGPYVMLAVSDDGVGMDTEIMSHIFEPFFTTKESGKGTGLGLATVYGIVKQSGGNVWVYSEPGKGSTFKVYLPRVEEGVIEPKPKAAAPTVLGGEETILLVEDDAALRDLISTALRKYGFTVLEASHGGEALLICEREKAPIHLMLTDVVMPQISGSALAERLTLLHPELKVLYMSGYTENAIVHLGVLDSAVNFIAKPFRLLGLVQKVREVLDSSKEKNLH